MACGHPEYHEVEAIEAEARAGVEAIYCGECAFWVFRAWPPPIEVEGIGLTEYRDAVIAFANDFPDLDFASLYGLPEDEA